MTSSRRETAGPRDACAACAGALVCPVCDERLIGDGRTLRCARGHAFDRAREGYYHLLPVGHGRSAVHGDTRDMARARRRVFERGVLEPVADAIGARVAAERATRRLTVLDAGCGEGYYIGRIAASFEGTASESACFIGVDVSKEALRLAARAHRAACFVVNDVKHRLTVASGSVDVLLDAFAPRSAAEFARVVHEGGLLLVAMPEQDHLGELRERLPLLGIEPGKRERAIEQLDAAFRLESEEVVDYVRELAADETLDLLRMTPNAWHLDAETLEQARARGRARVTFSVRLLALRRRPRA